MVLPTPDLSDLSKKTLRFTDGGTDIEEMMKTKGEEVVPWSNVINVLPGMACRLTVAPGITDFKKTPDLESHFESTVFFKLPMR